MKEPICTELINDDELWASVCASLETYVEFATRTKMTPDEALNFYNEIVKPIIDQFLDSKLEMETLMIIWRGSRKQQLIINHPTIKQGLIN